ncbi:MAG TPA: murein biosynthesis integral membrane protein MurJ [Ktedonobacteraceae bacterium]|nr:murein biosynthesis integral membrane protein MurJ [Ktedonobacteraceae bacterium]
MAVSTLDPQPELPPSPVQQAPSRNGGKHWGVGSFRFHFNLENFRPGRGFSLRRFSVAEAAVLLMMGILASRGLGVIRQVTFNAMFGTSVQASAYIAAFRLPDTLFNLVAGGTLIHAFIPIFVSYDKDRGEYETWRLTSLVFNVMFATLAALLLIAEFVAPTFVSRFLVPGFSPSEQALTISLTRIMLFQPLILGLSSVMSGVLSSRRQFVLPALAIAVYNIGLIGGLICAIIFPSIGIYGPTFGVLAAAACHFVVQVPGLVKQKARYFFVWDLKDPGLHAVLRLLIPSLLAVGVTSIGAVIDLSFTSFFRDKGSIAAINNAELLFALPVALLGQVVARAALPRMSLLALEQRYMHLRKMVIKVVGVAVLLSIPAALFLAVFGRPVIHLLFQHGAFTRRSSSLVYIALLGYALILPGRVADELLNRSFYALKDARTPLFMDIVALGARIGLIVMLVRLLHGKYLLLSIPLAVGGAAALEAVLLAFLLLGRLRAKAKTDQPAQRLQRHSETEESEETLPLYAEPEPVATNGKHVELVLEPEIEPPHSKVVEPELEPEIELPDSKVVEPEIGLEAELLNENLVIPEIAPETELPDSKLVESEGEPEAEQAEVNDLHAPAEELAAEAVHSEKERPKSVAKPVSSAKKRASSKRSAGKGNRQKRSGQRKS